MSPEWTRRADAPPLAWEPPVPLAVYWTEQDDPKKNTAVRLGRSGLVHLVKERRALPRRAILLDPTASRALSKDDLAHAKRHGIAAIDCSWARVSATYRDARRGFEPRALPFLVAANPTRFGRPFELSTAEAMAAALYILGFKKESHRLLSVFKWGPTFFDVNAQPLDQYEQARTSREIVAAQELFLPQEGEPALEPVEDKTGEGSVGASSKDNADPATSARRTD